MEAKERGGENDRVQGSRKERHFKSSNVIRRLKYELTAEIQKFLASHPGPNICSSCMREKGCERRGERGAYACARKICPINNLALLIYANIHQRE